MKYSAKEVKSEIIRKNGSTRLRIGGQDFYYSAFRSFRPSDENVPDFYNSGFKLFCIHSSGIMTALANRTIPYSEYGSVWVGDDEYNWENLKNQIDMFEKNSPGGYYAAMIDLNTPDWMLKNNPGMEDTWTQLIQEVSNPVWVESAKRYIKAYIEKLNELIPGKVFGIYLLAGGTTEWYTKHFEPSVDNPTENHLRSYGASIPGSKAFCGSDDGVLRSFEADRESLEYMKYYNSIVPDIICDMAKSAKSACNGNMAVGVFFGYVVSERDGIVSSNYNEAQKVFACPDIDIIIAPASYDLRKLKSSSGMRVPLETLNLEGKLYIHEIDSATHLTHNNKFAKLHGVPDDCMENLAQTSAYLRREIGMVLAKGHGYWLFDMFGGWYKDADTMKEIEKIRELSDKLSELDMKSTSEVAFIIDLTSNYHVSMDSDYPMFQFQAEELNRMGMPWDCYLTSDLFNEKFDDEKYKFYIFPNLFKADERITERIEALRAKGKSILFLHAPGYITDSGFSVFAMQKLTGIKLKRCDFNSAEMRLSAGKILDFSHKINEWRVNDPNKQRTKFNMPPVFEIDEKCETVGVLEADGGIGFGIKSRPQGGFDAFCTCAPVPCELLNMLAVRAGAFSNCDAGTVMYGNSKLLTVYSFTGGKVLIRTPEPATLTEYFTGEKYISSAEGVSVEFNPIETKIFLVD